MAGSPIFDTARQVTDALGHVEHVAEIAERHGVKKAGVVASALSTVNAAADVAKSVVAGGAAVASATTLTVAATSGAGIASGLAAAGGVVGAGMAAGPGVLAAGPAALATRLLNKTIFKDVEGLDQQEATARSTARIATGAGATAGVLGVGGGVVAGGASGAAIMSTLATVGTVVGGGALAGAAVLVVAPAVAAGVAGLALYKLRGGGKTQVATSDETAAEPKIEPGAAGRPSHDLE